MTIRLYSNLLLGTLTETTLQLLKLLWVFSNNLPLLDLEHTLDELDGRKVALPTSSQSLECFVLEVGTPLGQHFTPYSCGKLHLGAVSEPKPVVYRSGPTLTSVRKACSNWEWQCYRGLGRREGYKDIRIGLFPACFFYDMCIISKAETGRGGEGAGYRCDFHFYQNVSLVRSSTSFSF